ncbi:DNA cytosine methyltransferase [Microbacterium sp.]|uniref:DNA cytosine methyltransferase n=1 Tax=Microbacterium sp. TaxID=51671 RepID=UPI0039E2774C
MSETDDARADRRLRVGSLFSGYGGLDLAVEEVFDARTVWFSEINEPVARVFAHHWPGAPNLGDITTIDWNTVPPVDILCGGFPCQDVSTVGKMAGLAPGTRSGLWAHMATAIEVLQPQWVVIENVRGLLAATAIRPVSEGDDDERRNPATARAAAVRNLEPDPWGLGDEPARPLRALGAVLGDLADIGYDARWIGLPASHVGAPHARFRVFILARPALSHPARLRLDPRQRTDRERASQARDDHTQPSSSRALDQAGTRNLAGGDLRADRGVLRRWGRYAPAIARWEHITGRPAPAPAILNDEPVRRPAPPFVEWLMGLPVGWVTDPSLGLTQAQQLSALGNGVVPAHAMAALRAIPD